MLHDFGHSLPPWRLSREAKVGANTIVDVLRDVETCVHVEARGLDDEATKLTCTPLAFQGHAVKAMPCCHVFKRSRRGFNSLNDFSPSPHQPSHSCEAHADTTTSALRCHDTITSLTS